MIKNTKVPVLGFAAYSGTGKTTLLCQLIPLFKEAGIRVGIIKHAHHRFEIDNPKKDSHKLRTAGATQTMLASRHRWALITETNLEDDPQLDHLIAQLDQGNLDLILVEGFKDVKFPKIELHRPSLGKQLIFPEDKSIIAFATDESIDQQCPVPQLDIGNPKTIFDFIKDKVL